MKILILGSSGLLGNTITKYFLQKEDINIFATLRDHTKLKLFKKKYHKNFLIINDILDCGELKKTFKKIKPDILINCLGITNKQTLLNPKQIENCISINSLLPHMLQRLCSEIGIRLIHLSSDCVFSGSKGFYSENDIPDPPDIYGKSKLLGELNYENALTIRKSVIGHELGTKKGLLEWFLDQQNSVHGYKNVVFSGITVLELARVIDAYILPRRDLRGVLNLSGEAISKFDLLKNIAHVYKKSIEIIPNETIQINRTLNGSQFNNLTGYKLKSWSSLIRSMYEFNLSNK